MQLTNKLNSKQEMHSGFESTLIALYEWETHDAKLYNNEHTEWNRMNVLYNK